MTGLKKVTATILVLAFGATILVGCHPQRRKEQPPPPPGKPAPTPVPQPPPPGLPK